MDSNREICFDKKYIGGVRGKNRANSCHSLVLSLCSLLGGGLIYLCFRSNSLKMHRWLETIGLDAPLNSLRMMTVPLAGQLPDWALYALPDGLWVFAYVHLMLFIWENEKHVQAFFWILLIPILAIFSELGQSAGYIPGTFDPADLLLYSIGLILPLISSHLNLNPKTK